MRILVTTLSRQAERKLEKDICSGLQKQPSFDATIEKAEARKSRVSNCCCARTAGLAACAFLSVAVLPLLFLTFVSSGVESASCLSHGSFGALEPFWEAWAGASASFFRMLAAAILTSQ